MLNFAQNTQTLADNEVIINGFSFGKLTDADAKHLIDIIHGMQNLYGETAHEVSAPKSGLVFEEDLPHTVKAREISAPKDYEVVLEGRDNLVWFSCTSKDVRQVVNAQLKGAGFVYDKDAERPDTYKRDYTGKDGVTHKVGEHKKGAWVVMKGTKRDLATAKQWIGKTITVTANERQSIRDGWEARKARREG